MGRTSVVHSDLDGKSSYAYSRIIIHVHAKLFKTLQ